MRIAFLVNDLQLSGGIGVVVAHARELATRHGFDVTLVLVREQDEPHWRHAHLEHLHVATLNQVREQRFDVAVSTWWETAFQLFHVPAERYASFVQSLEDRFYRPTHEAERLGARVTLDLPVAFITEASWIRDTLADLRPDADCRLVRNGVDKDVFAPPAAPPDHDGPLRILVEGYANVWFKGVNDAIAATREMTEPHELTVVTPNRDGLQAAGATRVVGPLPQRELAALYEQTDVLLKLSRVEGMYGPPLEAFHKGATCVTTEVSGHEEYVRHAENALVVDWDDLRGAGRQLDLLARDRELLRSLRDNALQTARAWPSWEEAGAEMARALQAIAAAPVPEPYAAARALLDDLATGLEGRRVELYRSQVMAGRLARIDAVKARVPGLNRALAQLHRPAVKRLLQR